MPAVQQACCQAGAPSGLEARPSGSVCVPLTGCPKVAVFSLAATHGVPPCLRMPLPLLSTAVHVQCGS